MTELLEDIEVLENLVVAMNEGASDEKYMALHAVEVLLLKKKDTFNQFEAEMQRECGYARTGY
mgnify:CR=1 FL=1